MHCKASIIKIISIVKPWLSPTISHKPIAIIERVVDNPKNVKVLFLNLL